MVITFDQSGRIEYTSKDAVVAFSNNKNKSILLKAKGKRKIQKIFREHKKGSIFIYKTFASLIYTFHEAEIKHYLLQIIRKANKDFPKDNISFEQIGKKSNAHILAHKVYQKKTKADIIINADQIIRHVFRLK